MRKDEGENFTSCVQHVHVQQHESIFYTTPFRWVLSDFNPMKTYTFVPRLPVFERYKDVSFKETIVFLLTDYLTFQMIQYSKKTYDWLLQPRRTSVTAEYMII